MLKMDENFVAYKFYFDKLIQKEFPSLKYILNPVLFLPSVILGLPGGAMVKNPPANAGDEGDGSSLPGLRKSPGVGNGNSLLYSCQENFMDRGARWATVLEVRKSRTQLSTHILRDLTC